MPLLPTLLISLLVAYLFTLLAKKVRAPKVIGLIVAGILLGSTSLNGIILEPNLPVISNLSSLGFFVLMFLAGFEISWSMMFKERKDAFLVAFSASLIPLLLGTVIIHAIGYPMHTALAVGICMSITAEAIKATVLLELKKLRTKVGAILMGSGILEEILGLILFIALIYSATGDIVKGDLLNLIIAIGLFAAGIVVHRFIGRENHVLKSFEKWSFHLIVPFFFINMGTNFSIDSLVGKPWLFFLIFGIALFGKMIGSFLTKPMITDLSWKQLYLIGWGMNSRGTIEIAIAFIALQTGILPDELYSSIVLTVMVTIFIFPEIIRYMVKKDRRIMDR